MLALWKDKNIYEKHFDELNNVIKFCKKKSIPTVVILFPIPGIDRELNDSFLVPVENLFRKEKMPVLNLSDLLYSLPLKKCILSSTDMHPSPFFHNLIAEKLYSLLL